MLEEEIQNAIKELSESGDTDLCENLIRDQGVQRRFLHNRLSYQKHPCFSFGNPLHSTILLQQLLHFSR